MRQLAPISPAIHLGAHRVLVVGTGFRDETHPENREDTPPYPSLAQVGGHALSVSFWTACRLTSNGWSASTS